MMPVHQKGGAEAYVEHLKKLVPAKKAGKKEEGEKDDGEKEKDKTKANKEQEGTSP